MPRDDVLPVGDLREHDDDRAVPVELQSTFTRLRGALTRSTVERILARSAAIFGLLLSLQAIPVVTASAGFITPIWLVVEPVVLFGSLVLVVVTAIAQRGVRASMLLFAGLYIVAFAAWPLCVSDVARAAGTQPWLWSLIAVAMAYVAVALPVIWAGLYIVVVTVIYVVIHQTPAGGAGTLKGGVLDAVYVLLIGAFMLMLVVTLRAAANRVDAAHQAAMQQYERAARNYAGETERAKVDALVHDSVLATLISSARAETPTEQHAAAQMAAAALETLQKAPGAFEPDADVTQAEFAERLTDAARLLSPRVAIVGQPFGSHRVPAAVADALFAAAVQALINSLQHAGDTTDACDVVRTISLFAEGGGLTVLVADTGKGFDVDAVPSMRLGLRVSIRERVHRVGGHVAVTSVVGGGTSVLLSWHPEVSA